MHSFVKGALDYDANFSAHLVYFLNLKSMFSFLRIQLEVRWCACGTHQ